MPGKLGMKHSSPGPKLAASHAYPVGAEPDPAKGARVPRCRACGLPNPIDMIGVRGGVYGRFPVCDRCWFEVNPPDPLHVPEAA